MNEAPTIEVLYTCDWCKTTDRAVRVRERKHGEPMSNWMHAVAIAISAAHRQTSPRCGADRMANVKIPMPPGADAIGRVVRN